MPKKRPQVSIDSYGRYTAWDSASTQLPKCIKYTTIIEAIENTEFGIVIQVDHLKGEVLDFIIKHPPISDDNNNLLPQFKGKLHVNSKHAQFFVGDCIWLPLEDKIGLWEIIIYHRDRELVAKKFDVVPVIEK